MQKNVSENQKYYQQIAKKYRNKINFLKVQDYMRKNIDENYSEINKTIYFTSIMVIGPILLSYVVYILRDAEKRKVRKLYFLSRDGYILCKIAKILCVSYKLPIECEYLYVSRLALRAPLYYINKTEAIKYLCESSYKVTPNIILKRAGITEEKERIILNQINYKTENEILNEDEIHEFVQKLIENDIFDKEAYNYSKAKFNCISKYFKQEGLDSEKEYAIVDVGWMGSMQRHISEILSYMGIEKSLKGYYFGMFKNADYKNGEYNCFYFSKDKHSKNRVFFNNNLFECMCSANHGMTIDYQIMDNEKIIPILNEFKKEWNVDLQIDTIEKFTENFVMHNNWGDMDEKILIKIVKEISIKFMMFPDKIEAYAYGNIPFCDDPTESYKLKLAEALSKDELIKYNILYKVYKNLFFRSKESESNKSFWINGSIQLSEVKHKKMFSIFCILSEYLHYLKI